MAANSDTIYGLSEDETPVALPQTTSSQMVGVPQLERILLKATQSTRSCHLEIDGEEQIVCCCPKVPFYGVLDGHPEFLFAPS